MPVAEGGEAAHLTPASLAPSHLAVPRGYMAISFFKKGVLLKLIDA